MKNGGKKVLLIAIIVAASGFGSYRLGTHIFGAHQFHFSLDPQLSPAMHKAITAAVYESHATDLASLCARMRHACPALEQVSVERRADNKMYIAAKGMDPYVCINTKVLTTSGVLVDNLCFNHDAFGSLPVITQKDLFGKATITDEFTQWLLRLDPSVFALYDVVWNDDFSIELHDKENAQQTILCSISTAPDKSLRELCQRIIEEKIICAQGTARKYVYTADVRFEKQIIICSHKGGAYHG